MLLLTLTVSALAACSSTPRSSAEIQEERATKQAKATLGDAPDWFLNQPKSTTTMVYAVGDGISTSITGAYTYARANALETVCQAAGGTVRSNTEIYRQDSVNSGSGVSTTAIRNSCPDVDVSGATIENKFISREGSRFRAYVLVAYDTTSATNRGTQRAADRAFKKLDQMNAKPVQ
jgi:hypothetical protein